MKYNIGDKVYYPRLQACGVVQDIITQAKGISTRYVVKLVAEGVYSVPEESLVPFKSQKKTENLGTKKQGNRDKTPLEASLQKEAISVPSRFKPVPQAGIFVEEDLAILADRYNKDVSRPKQEKPPKPFKRVTIANATQEQVRNALHKALVRGKLG